MKHYFPLLLLSIIMMTSCGESSPESPTTIAPPTPINQITPTTSYPLHHRITATIFWIGEPAAPNSPANTASSWDPHWMLHYGGLDDPIHRHGYAPATFTPKLNPFYVALPYNDLTAHGRRPTATQIIPWAKSRTYGPTESMCHNRWLRITHAGRTVYAQWQDVGPFLTDDAAYVFGTASPRNTHNGHAGIDVSPAVRDFLQLHSGDSVDWQFIEAPQVPPGPWKR